MQPIELAKKLEGLQIVDTIKKKLNISRSTAIKYVHILRKNGMVRTEYAHHKKRWYYISPLGHKEIGNPGLYDIINKYSKVGLIVRKNERIVGRKMTIEEALVRAVTSNDIRTILAALGLFAHIKNWKLLYKLAKESNICRKLGALYDVARTIIKTKRMDRRIYNKLRLGNEDKFIIKNVRSKDFIDIQNKWRVYVPLNRADLLKYKE